LEEEEDEEVEEEEVEVDEEDEVHLAHHQEVDGATQPRRRQLQAKHHVQLGTLEPGDGVGVLGDHQGLPAQAEDEPAHLHHPQPVHEGPRREHRLPHHDGQGE